MKRILPIALLLVGTLLAVAAGWGTNAVLGSFIALQDGDTLQRVPDTPSADEPSDSVQADATEPTGARSSGMSRRQYVDAIMRRNIFDHNNVDKQESKPDCEGPDCAQGEKSDLPVMLIATLVKQPALYSTAYIMDENSKESKVYRVDSMLLDARIERIYTKRIIVVRGDGTREFIVMGEDDKVERGGAPASASSGDDPDKIGDDEYNIPREIIDNALKNIDQLAKMARARPHKDDSGNIDGYRLSGVRRGKLPYKLGIKNGDVVHSVNGIPLTSTQQALTAWQSLQNEANFTFDITRRGQKKTMKYHVR